MTTNRFERLLPLAGVLGGLIWAAAAVLTINEPSITDGEQKYVRWFTDHKTRETVAGFGSIYFCVLMLMFAGAVSHGLRAGERGSSAHAAVAFGGAVATAAGITMLGMVSLANADASGKHDAQAVISLGYLADNNFLLLVAGVATFYLATGLGALRTGMLPKWLAIVTIVLGVLSLCGPIGIGVYFASPIWLIVAGALLYRRQPVPTAAPVAATRPTVDAR